MEKIQKVIKVLINALMTLILIVGILFILLFMIGIEPFVVKSGSMQPTIQTGSLSFINKHAKYKDVKENDIIAFKATSGDKVTHRAISITDEGIETKGDSNERTDGITTTEKNFIGKNIFSIPKLGYVVMLIQTTRGKIMLVTIIIIILVAGFLEDAKKKGKRSKDKK
ncbi:MAG TPA: signal peptidase I [Clostridiales bacterium]|nr:signal peptidase I [Clostridiales bacterium]